MATSVCVSTYVQRRKCDIENFQAHTRLSKLRAQDMAEEDLKICVNKKKNTVNNVIACKKAASMQLNCNTTKRC